MAAIEVRGLRKRFGSIEALRGLDLEVREGEILGLLGPNGAGKSTLVRALVGRVRPDAGEMRLFGLEAAAARAQLGYVPQELALYDGLSARENLDLFGRLLGLEGDPLRSRVAWGLEFSSLVDRQDELVGTFSGGMKRRLNLAAGILAAPRAALFDEPTVGVDPQSRERIFDMVRQLRQRGTTVLYATHYLEEAERLCDRVAIIDHGQVLRVGGIEELVREVLGGTARAELELGQDASGALEQWLRGLGAELRGSRVELELADPALGLAKLLEELSRRKVAVRDLRLHRPGLDEVFLKLTGRELRE